MTATLTDQVFLPEIARMLGVAYDTAKSYHQRGVGNFPPAAGRVEGQFGRTRPWWHRADVEAWIAGRPGSGNYERSVREGPHSNAGIPRKHSGRRVPCPSCTASIELTLSGSIRAHGPHGSRCAGSGATP